MSLHTILDRNVLCEHTQQFENDALYLTILHIDSGVQNTSKFTRKKLHELHEPYIS